MENQPQNKQLPFWGIAIIAIFLLILLAINQDRGANLVSNLNGIDQDGYNSDQSGSGYSYGNLENPLPGAQNSDPINNSEPTPGYQEISLPSDFPFPVAVNSLARFATPGLHAVLRLGETATVRWESNSNLENIRLSIYQAAVSECGFDKDCLGNYVPYVKSFSLASNLNASGEYNWQIGEVVGESTLEPGQYNLRLETAEGVPVGDSETFAIVNPNEPTMIDVAVPYDPDSLPYPADPLTYSSAVPYQQAVMWRSTPSIFFVDIFVRSKDCGTNCQLGNGLYQIADSAANGFLFGWLAGRDINGGGIPPGEYELFVRDSSNSAVESTARIFTLK